MELKLEKIDLIEAQLELLSGLHIGGEETEIHIGGIDNSVIKNPLTNLPYIPGSSLKGKIRSLLEWKTGLVKETPLSYADYEAQSNDNQKQQIKRILQLFGNSGDSKANDLGPTRAAFWDCNLNQVWLENIRDNNLPLTEEKTENTISRISSKATNPRQTERVPAGAIFNFTLSLKKFSADDETLLNTLLQGLKLLELDSLGGSGSRGYGKIRFNHIKINQEDKTQQFAALAAFA